MLKPITKAVLLCVCLAMITSPAIAEKNTTTGFGTLKKFDPKGQQMQITEYNWDTLDVEDTLYVYNVRRVKLFNMDAVTELKEGDEVEFEWTMHSNKKYISQISKGSMPMENIELLWDVNAPIDVETETEPLTEQAPVEPATEQAPVEPAAEQAPVEPATEQAAGEPAMEQTPVEPAVEKAVVEPDTVQTPE